MAITLAVEESIDATYFTIQNVGDTVVSTSGKTLTVYKDNVALGSVITFTTENINNGIVIEISDLGLSITEFEDGIYVFILKNGASELARCTEGFAAAITLLVMKNNLSYRLGMDSKEKYMLDEQRRLLDCMEYAATIGSIESYNECLGLLQDIV